MVAWRIDGNESEKKIAYKAVYKGKAKECVEYVGYAKDFHFRFGTA